MMKIKIENEKFQEIFEKNKQKDDKNEEILEEIFPDEPEELINDMAPGIYLTAFAIAEFQNPLVGGVVRDGLGFSWASALYSGTLAVYFVGYWGKIILGERAYQEIRNGG